MYTGNGVTRKFLLPSGVDGSEVYLIFPTGQSIKMKRDQGYTVSEGAVYFSGAVPAGVEVSFTEPEGYGEQTITKGYVVIYNDGRIVQEDFDPAEYLLESQKILSEAKKHHEEVTQYAEEAILRVMTLKEELGQDVERLLYTSTVKTQNLLEETASRLKEEISAGLDEALTSIRKEAETVEAGLQIMEQLKEETSSISEASASATKASIEEKCNAVLSAYGAMQKLKSDCEYYCEEARSAARKAGLETQAAMSVKAEEELEMLKSLRLKLESDSETMNKRIDNALEMLRSELDGR